MRRILVDHARMQKAEKRGSGQSPIVAGRSARGRGGSATGLRGAGRRAQGAGGARPAAGADRRTEIFWRAEHRGDGGSHAAVAGDHQARMGRRPRVASQRARALVMKGIHGRGSCPVSTNQGVLVEALELPPAERPAFLATACGDDRELRAEVESLLAVRRRGRLPRAAAAQRCRAVTPVTHGTTAPPSIRWSAARVGPIPRDQPARRRRHGRRLPRRGHAPRPPRGAQVPAGADLSVGEEAKARFIREARAVAALDHPEHLHAVRHRPHRRSADVSGHGVLPGRDAEAAARARPSAARASASTSPARSEAGSPRPTPPASSTGM